MAEARESFADVFAYGVLFEQMAQAQRNAFQPSVEHVRNTIEQLLAYDEATKALSQEEYNAARFAVVAWIDETILRHSTWQHYHEWAVRPLQLKYYGTDDGGREFFQRLESLRPNQVTGLTIYYRCLMLGFSGRYKNDPGGLNRIRQDTAQKLPRPAEGEQTSDTLISQPYHALSPRSVSKPLVWTERLRKVTRVLLVAAPLMVLLVKMITVELPESKLPKTPTLRARVSAILDASRPCEKITYDVDESARLVTLKGWILSVARRDEISTSLRQVGAQQVDVAALDLVPSPLCDVLNLVAPRQAVAPSGVSMILKKGMKKDGQVVIVAESPTSFCEDDVLVIEVKLPPFASYIYIDYYDTQGRVAHVFPNRFDPQNLKKPHATFEIGRAVVQDEPLRIELPAGRDLVTVIASNTELFPKSEFMAPAEAVLAVKPITSYLTMLQKLQGVSKPGLVTTFAFLHNQGECER